MILELFLLLVTTIVIYYVYTYRRLQQNFEKRGVKTIPGVPLFGNTLRSSFAKAHLLDDLDKAYNAHPDDRYVGFLEMTTPIILIRDPDLMKNIIVKDFDHFTDHREFFSEEFDPLFAASIFLMKGNRWRDMRNTLSPAFTTSKMKIVFPSMPKSSENIVQYLNEHQGENIDVNDVVRRYTNDVIALAGFGYEVNSVKDRDNQMYKIGSNILEFDFRQRMMILMISQFPNLSKKFGFHLYTEDMYIFFDTFVANTIELRKKEKVKRPDMINLLLETEKDWTPQELASQVFSFFAAGYDTSASAITMCIHELALHPDIQEKLYQECRKFKEEKEFNFENLNLELKYLDACLNEAMRIWSPAIFLDRQCTKAYELPPPREGGKPYLVKPGELVYNLINQIHLDPKYWPDPYKYDPDRFSEENKNNIKPFTFGPFGIGPRACIGVRFAMLEMKVLMYYLVLNFKIVKTEKTVDPIKLAPMTFVIKAKGGTFVKFEKRAQE